MLRGWCSLFGQGFTSWVGLRALSVPRLQGNWDRLSKRLRTQCCLSVLSFTDMLLHLLRTPPIPPHQTGKYQPNCPDTVNHFLPTGAASPPMCFYLWNFNCTFFPALHKNRQNYRIRATIRDYFMSMQNMGKHVEAVNDPTWSNQVIGQYFVISCNHKTCRGEVFLSLWLLETMSVTSSEPCQVWLNFI